MRLRYVLAVLMLVTMPSLAAYNSNISGRVLWVANYMDGDYIYFALDNQPTSHPGCSPTYFVISEDVPQNRRNQALAQLLVARETGNSLNIGYDSSGDCAHGYIRVHRVG